MSCEQVLYSGRKPTSEYELISSESNSSLRYCSQKCCNDSNCGIFHYNTTTGVCNLHKLPKWLIYIPVPSAEPPVVDISRDPNDVIGVLMKRKIRTWIPWIFAVLVLISFAILQRK